MSGYCDVCGRIGGHLDGCPNNTNYYEEYEYKKYKYCYWCNERILNGEQYIEDDLGNYAHLNCFNDCEDLCEWLDIPINKEE